MWPVVDLDDILHGRHEGCVGIRRDHPLVVQVRLENVFLSVRPMVLSLARATMFSFDDLALQHLQRPPRKAFGWCRAGQGDQLRLAGAVEDPPSGGIRERLGMSTPSTPSSTSCWRTRETVTGLVCNPTAIWLSVNASPASEASAFSRMRARSNLRAECLPVRISASSSLALLGAQRDDIPLDRSLSRRHRIDPRSTDGSAIRRNRSLSMTRGTSAFSPLMAARATLSLEGRCVGPACSSRHGPS